MTYIGSEIHNNVLYTRNNYTTAFWDHVYSNNTNITSYSCYETSYGNYKKKKNLSVYDPINSTMLLQVMSSYSINNKYNIKQSTSQK